MKFILLLTFCGMPHMVEWSDGEKIYFMQYADLTVDMQKAINLQFKDKKSRVEIYDGACA